MYFDRRSLRGGSSVGGAGIVSVSAVLVTYRRPASNLVRIVERLAALPFISEILVRDQNDGKAENLNVYGRYVLAQQAINDVIYTQDDDCVIGNIEVIKRVFDLDPTRIAFGLAPTHYPLWEGGAFQRAEPPGVGASLAMMGWGAFFNRYWLRTADPQGGPRVTPLIEQLGWKSIFLPYCDRHGLDENFRREADRIFSLLLNRRHAFVRADVEHLPGAESADALASEPEHWVSRDRAISRCLEILRETYNRSQRATDKEDEGGSG